MVETKTAQYVHDIELHFTEEEKRTQTRKLRWRVRMKIINFRVFSFFVY